MRQIPQNLTPTFEFFTLSSVDASNELSCKISRLIAKTNFALEQIVRADKLEDLCDLATNLNALISTDIVYKKTELNGKLNEEENQITTETNKRLYGGALTVRLNRFSHLIKETRATGLNASSADQIDTEALTLQSISEWRARNIPKSETVCTSIL